VQSCADVLFDLETVTPGKLSAPPVLRMNAQNDLGHLRAAETKRKLQVERQYTLDTLVSPPAVNTVAPIKPAIPTPALLLAMLQVSDRVSDLIFSPGSLPHVEVRAVS